MPDPQWEVASETPAPASGGWEVASEKPASTPRGWSDSVSDFGKELWKQVNPIGGIKGLAQLVQHPMAANEADVQARSAILDKADAAFKRGDYTEGAMRTLYGLVPMLGPQLNEAGERFSRGEYAKGSGQSVGIGLNLAGPGAIKNIPGAQALGDAAQGAAKRIYQSALKPPPGSYSTAEVGSMVKTGLESGIPVSAEGATKLSGLIQDLGDKVKAQIAAGNTGGATINKFAVASRLRDTAKKFATQVNPTADLNAISESGQEFLQNQPGAIPAQDAQALKQGTYQQLKDRSFGELGSATKEAQKSLARGIKEELEQQFPEIKGLNAQQGKLIGLDEALDRAVRRIDNREIFGLPGQIGATLAGTAVGAITGHTAEGVGAATAALLLQKVLTDPMVKSKLAITLNAAGKGAQAASPRMAGGLRVAGYLNALGNSVNSVGRPTDNQDRQ